MTGRLTWQQVADERWPEVSALLAEQRQPVPDPPAVYRPVKGSYRGPTTRLEQLLLASKARAWRVHRGIR